MTLYVSEQLSPSFSWCIKVAGALGSGVFARSNTSISGKSGSESNEYFLTALMGFGFVVLILGMPRDGLESDLTAATVWSTFGTRSGANFVFSSVLFSSWIN